MSVNVKGRVAIVTGAGGGLGYEYAFALAQAGAKVVVVDYGGDITGGGAGEDSSRAQKAADKIVSAGGVAIANSGDVTKDAKSIIATAVDHFGSVDIIVNNAGVVGKIAPEDDVDPENFMRVIEISALGTAMMTSAAYPYMKRQGWGRIINISSGAVVGLDGGGDCAYSASKGAVFAMTREMGRYALRHGIKVNGVCPSGASRLTAQNKALHELCEKYMQPHQVAALVLLLASDECPVSGELFNGSGENASRLTFVTFAGSNKSTPEGYLKDRDKVMGREEDAYFVNSTSELLSFFMKQLTGESMEELANFGNRG